MPISSAAVFAGMTDAGSFDALQRPLRQARSLVCGVQACRTVARAPDIRRRSARWPRRARTDGVLRRFRAPFRHRSSSHHRPSSKSDRCLCAHRGSERSRRRVGESDDASFVRSLEPHVRRALEVHSRLEDADGRSQLHEDALDSLSVGVVCVNASGDAVFVNAQARRIAKARDGFGFDGARPTSPSAASRSALQHLLPAALGSHAALGQLPSAPLLIPRRSGRPPYRIEVTPARQGVGAGGRLSRGAILFIIDPVTQPAANASRLVALFG